MSEEDNETRYAYVKNGDVVTQIHRMAAVSGEISSGPDAFLSDFLSGSANGAVLLMSRGNRSLRVISGDVDARVFADGTGLLTKLWKRPLVSMEVLWALLRFRPDRIVCSSSGGGVMWATYIAARLLSVPFVHSRHNRVVHSGDRWHRRLGTWIDGCLIKRADAVVCHGPYLKHQLLEIGVSEQQLLEFDVRFDDLLEELATGSSVRASPPGGTRSVMTILFVGRVEVNKGVTDLLEAALPLMSADPSIRLVFAGTGSHVEDLRRAAEASEVEGRIDVLGEVAHHEMAALMAGSALVVAPSRTSFSEGRCMVVMESMVVGVPVIAPDFGPFPFLVKHRGNGLLYTPDSVEALRDALHQALSEPALLDALCRGARQTGLELREPPMTFSEAVNASFLSSSRLETPSPS